MSCFLPLAYSATFTERPLITRSLRQPTNPGKNGEKKSYKIRKLYTNRPHNGVHKKTFNWSWEQKKFFFFRFDFLPCRNPADHNTGGKNKDSILASKPPINKGLISSNVSASPGVAKLVLSASTCKAPDFRFRVISTLCQAPSSKRERLKIINWDKIPISRNFCCYRKK